MSALAAIWLALSVLSALVLAVDIVRRPQTMAVMNPVWPITALYLGPLAAAAYAGFGRAGAHRDDGRRDRTPHWQSLFLGASHCGAGCTLGDIAGEWLVFAAGWTIAGSTLFAYFAADFALAYLIGIIFQFFSTAPMRGLGLGAGLAAAVKADTISIAAFEIGMFAWMALAHFVLAPGLTPLDPRYWFMMQIAMIAGFVTTLPANHWLIRRGLKEAM